MTVIATAWRLYVACLRPVAFLFGGITLAISLLALIGLTDLGRPQLFLVFLSQVALPAFLGSVGLAGASIIFRAYSEGRPVGLKSSLQQLRPLLRPVALASLFSGMLSLWAIILLGELGFVLMPLFFGPPILIHAIALERLPLTAARVRARQVISGKTIRVILYILVTVLGLGLLDGGFLSLAVAIAGAATDGLVARLILSAIQVLVAGLSLPFLAAAEHVCYVTLANVQEDSPS